MLKAVSSFVNVIGALNYKGTWNASTNNPSLISSVGTKGDYYVVSVAGSTTLDGISNWGVGDWAAFNGVAWQRVEGGADLNGVNLSVSGTSTLSSLTASTSLALNTQKEIISVTNTGSGNNVLTTSPQIDTPTLTGDVQQSTGNLIIGTAAKGINFTANTPAAGKTSQLLNYYEEGTWTVTWSNLTGTPTNLTGYYTRVGRLVTFQYSAGVNSISGTGDVVNFSLPFNPAVGSVGSMLSQTNANSGNIFISAGSIAYPQTFSGPYLVFAGSFIV